MNDLYKKLDYYQDLFGLNNWHINLVVSQLQVQNHHAMTLADPRYHKATITVYPNLITNPAAYDETIIHELIHIVFAMYDYFADNLGKEGSDDMFFIAREAGVSAMTSIIMRIIGGGEHGQIETNTGVQGSQTEGSSRPSSSEGSGSN